MLFDSVLVEVAVADEVVTVGPHLDVVEPMLYFIELAGIKQNFYLALRVEAWAQVLAEVAVQIKNAQHA